MKKTDSQRSIVFQWSSSAAVILSLAFSACGENADETGELSQRDNFGNEQGVDASRPQESMIGDNKVSGVEPWKRTEAVSGADDSFDTSDEESEGSSKKLMENPRFNADESSVSTFSIDVDTSAYSYMRSEITQGRLPEGNHVRIEEFLNYFQYGYEAPVWTEGASESAPISVTMDVGPSPWSGGKSHLMRVGLRAADAPSHAYKAEAGRNLVFLVDTSGSMSWNGSLALVQSSLRSLLENIQPMDRLSLVTYAGSSQVVLPPTEGSQTEKIMNAIEGLKAGGGTNGADGIKTAYELARSVYIEGGINRVFLATDGDFNVGVTSHEGLVDLIAREANQGIFLTVLGVGGRNYNDALLEEISNKGNGYAAYIDSELEGRRVLSDRLTSGVITVAKDVKVQVDFNPRLIKTWRLIGYENRVLSNEDFANDKVDAGEMGSGHETTALYELELTEAGIMSLQPGHGHGDGKTAEDSLAALRFRFKDPFGSESREIVATPDVAKSHPETFEFAAGVACYGMALKRSNFRENCDYKMAASLIEKGLNQDHISASERSLRAQLLDLVQRASLISNEGKD